MSRSRRAVLTVQHTHSNWQGCDKPEGKCRRSSDQQLTGLWQTWRQMPTFTRPATDRAVTNLKANADVHSTSEARADWTRWQAEVGKQFRERRCELDTRPLLGNYTQCTNVWQVNTPRVQRRYWRTELLGAQVHHVIGTECVSNCNEKKWRIWLQVNDIFNTVNLLQTYVITQLAADTSYS